MNTTNQNHTDNFFKQGLSSPPEFSPSDKNWKDMEQLLKSEPKRRSIVWIYLASGIAAALLIFLSLWRVSETPGTDTERTQIAKSPEKKPNTANELNSTLGADQKKDSEFQSGRSLLGNNTSHASSIEGILPNNDRRDAINKADGNSLLSIDQKIAADGLAFTSLSNAKYVNINRHMTDRFVSLRPVEQFKPSANALNSAAAEGKSPKSANPSVPGKWALSMALSPDLNSVKGIENSDFGLSMGMGVSYKLGKALRVGTGLYYSKKLYSADKTSYKVTEKPFATWTSYSKQIDADCRVIDVPLNLSLQLSNKTANKISASAGLSSYIMLSEKYEFVYTPSPAYPTGRREYTVRNQNKHLLSVVNLGIAVERPLSNQVSVVIQPYAKLPLTGIGQGETNLKSFGVGFQLNYSLKKK